MDFPRQTDQPALARAPIQCEGSASGGTAGNREGHMTRTGRGLLAAGLLLGAGWVGAAPLVYEGTEGPGRGKHIVWLAGDHEYRSEESLPAMARLMAQRHGFKCTVLFTLDRTNGVIVPGESWMPGTEVLKQADAAVFFLRFLDLPAEQMQPIVDFLARGGPVIGLRTATHAFKIPKTSPFARFAFNYGDADYTGGFGRQVLGETWAGHYGKNHSQSTRLTLVPEAAGHPVLRGVKDPWVQAGAYFTKPMADSTILAMAQPLNGMQPDAPADETKASTPGAWVRTYTGSAGGTGRVFTSTYGASEDILNEGFRRMLVNACFWVNGLEAQITPTLAVDFVGPYQPATFNFNGYRREVRPEQLAGWTSPIMPTNHPTRAPGR